jgi:hypothetical protein
MARYKHYDYGQTKMLPVSYERQILAGTFEHTLSFLIDHKIDNQMSVLEGSLTWNQTCFRSNEFEPHTSVQPLPSVTSSNRRLSAVEFE